MSTTRGRRPTPDAISIASVPSSQTQTANQSSATTEPPVKFSPPYLRYNVPEEYAKIKASIAAIHKQAVKLYGGHIAVDASGNIAHTAKAIEAEEIPSKEGGLGVGAIRGGGRSTGSQVLKAPGREAGVKLTELKTLTPQIVPQNKGAAVASTGISTVPSGTVNIGFWCDTTFRVKIDFKATYYIWRLIINGDQSYGLGNSWKPEIEVLLDGPTYKLGAYYGGSTTLSFHCEPVDLATPTSPMVSDPIVLQFSQNTPCLEIHSVGLSTNQVTGGKNGTEPVLTVALTGPAPPGGQIVFLESDKPNKAWIMGDGYYTIPAGQVSEPLSYFLGTKNVTKDHDVLLTAKVNGKKGHAHITIKK